jgi:hypothetical protein
MSAFLDPTKPIATCIRESCQNCPVATRVHCHFQGSDLTHFLISMLPAFVTAGMGIVHVGWLWLLPWIAICLAYFGLLEIRVMCSHCPHYAEPGNSLKCWANYGSPKLWKYRPGPMSGAETFWFYAVGYPLTFLLLDMQWTLLLLYVLTTAAAGSTLNSFLCTQCMNFACPFNRIDVNTRHIFWEQNPTIAEAWGWKR